MTIAAEYLTEARKGAPLDWSDDPDFAGPEDAAGGRLEPLWLTMVFTGERPFNPVDFTDDRCRAVAAVCASCREAGVRVEPHTVVSMLHRMGLYGPGCRAWVAKALYDVPLRARGRR